MRPDESAGDRLSIRGTGYCVLLAALVFTWPVVGTIALRHLLLGGLLVLLLTDRAVRTRIVGVLRDRATPVILLLLLTGWIVIHSFTLSQYPAYSQDELRGQWFKPLLIFGIGMLLAARVRTEPALLAAILAAVKWALAFQIAVVLGDLCYLWWRDIHLSHGTVRLTGTRTSISYTVLLMLSVMAGDWLRNTPPGTLAMPARRMLLDAAMVVTALWCLVLIGSRYGIVLSLALLTAVAAVISYRQVRRGSARRALLLLALAACATTVALYGAARFDPRWERMAESAALVFAPGHENDWRLLSDAQPPRFDDGSPVESSAFLRVARFRAGLDLIAERPLGWGFGRSAMEHIVQMRHQAVGIASDSGLVDFTLALGLPGTALWLAFMGSMLNTGWRARSDAKSVAPLLLVIVVNIFMVRFVIDINTRDHMFEMFLLLCGMLGGATVTAAPTLAGRR